MSVTPNYKTPPIPIEAIRAQFTNAPGAAVLHIQVHESGVVILALSTVEGEDPMWVHPDAHTIMNHESDYTVRLLGEAGSFPLKLEGGADGADGADGAGGAGGAGGVGVGGAGGADGHSENQL